MDETMIELVMDIYTVFERITEGMLIQVSWEADKKRLDEKFF